MANGDALKKRYEVRDAETGEVVEDAYVLRSKEDQFAWTVMYAYARLCGLDYPVTRLVTDASERPGSEYWSELIESRLNLAPDCESFNGDQIVGLSNIGLGDGTAERAVTLMKATGYEPVTVVCRRIGDEEADEASKRLDNLDAAQSRRGRTAGQAVTRIEGPDERAIFPSKSSRRKVTR